MLAYLFVMGLFAYLVYSEQASCADPRHRSNRFQDKEFTILPPVLPRDRFPKTYWPQIRPGREYHSRHLHRSVF